jgi:hypothetical protein
MNYPLRVSNKPKPLPLNLHGVYLQRHDQEFRDEQGL